MRAAPSALGLAAALALTALAAPPVRGQDLVANGHFHTDLSGWTFTGAPFGSQSWSSEDWQSAAGSGSILVTNDAPLAPWGTGSSTPCLALASSGTYELSAEIRVPAGQAGTGSTYAAVFWYSDATCSSQIDGDNAPVVLIPSSTSWTTTYKGSVAFPPGAVSAQVWVYVVKNVAGGTVFVHFDRVRFGPVGTTPAVLTHFGVE